MPDERAQRVLHVSRNMPPLVGGMERLNWHIANELQRRVELMILAPRGSAALAPSGVVSIEVPSGPLPIFLSLAALSAIRVARVLRPVVVIACSGFMAPVAELAARVYCATQIPVLRGCAGHVDNSTYKSV